MRKYVFAFALFISAVASWTDAAACSCLRPVLADLYKDSTHVILGEVVKVELVTQNPVHNQDATYVATVKAAETYKGASDVEVRITYKARYLEPGKALPPLPTTVDEETGEELEIIQVGGCEGGLAVGARLFVFEKQGEPLHYGGWCTQRVMHESIIKPDYMRSLRDDR
jgi:hypothetical protein